MADPYTWSNSDVLKNKFGIRDGAALQSRETIWAELRTNELLSSERGAAQTSDAYRELHRQLFSDVYDWAGKFRTVDISKMGSTFARSSFIGNSMVHEFKQLPSRDELTAMDRNGFADAMGRHISELNAIHPFREGNGRTMRAHLVLHARGAEKPFDPPTIERSAWLSASGRSFMTGNHAPIAEVILNAMPNERGKLEALRGAGGIALPPPVDAALPSAERRSMTIAEAKDVIDRHLVTAQSMAGQQYDQLGQGSGTQSGADQLAKQAGAELAFLQDAKGPMHLLQLIEQRRYGEIGVDWLRDMDALQKVRAVSAGAAAALDKMPEREVKAADRALANQIMPRGVGQVDIRLGQEFMKNSPEANRADPRFAPLQGRIDTMLEKAAQSGARKDVLKEISTKATKIIGDAISQAGDPEKALSQMTQQKDVGPER